MDFYVFVNIGFKRYKFVMVILELAIF